MNKEESQYAMARTLQSLIGHFCNDTKTLHVEVDRCLIIALRYEGYNEAMDIYEKLPKKYV